MSFQTIIFMEGLQVFVSLLFLLYASWSDLKTREVSNWVWVFYAPIGLALSLILLFVLDFSYDMLYLFSISVGVTSALALALFYVGAFGGADAKALICISFTLPFYPSHFISFTSTTLIFPLSVFSNAIIIAALSVLYVLLRNAFWRQRTGRRLFENLEDESNGRKILALLSGYKIPITKLKNSFLYPLEDVQVSEGGEPKRKLLTFPKDEEREEIVNRVLTASEGEKNEYVWATPGLPMLVFITAGLITALILGDFVWIALTHLLA
jgi:preflagellin peptidase FlaK